MSNQLLDINGYHFIVNSLEHNIYGSLHYEEYTIKCTPFEDKDKEFIKRWSTAMFCPEFRSNKYYLGIPKTTGFIEGLKPIKNLIIQFVEYNNIGDISVIFMSGGTLDYD